MQKTNWYRLSWQAVERRAGEEPAPFAQRLTQPPPPSQQLGNASIFHMFLSFIQLEVVIIYLSRLCKWETVASVQLPLNTELKFTTMFRNSTFMGKVAKEVWDRWPLQMNNHNFEFRNSLS